MPALAPVLGKLQAARHILSDPFSLAFSLPVMAQTDSPGANPPRENEDDNSDDEFHDARFPADEEAVRLPRHFNLQHDS